MEDSNLFNFLSKLFFSYLTLITFIVSIGRPIFGNHEKFFNRPETILAAGYFFVANTMGSKSYALYAALIYYVTTISINNITDTYDEAFGVLSPYIMKLSEYFGFIELEDNFDLENSDSDSDFN